MLSLRHSTGNTSLVGTELGGVPKAYRIPVVIPALPALISVPLVQTHTEVLIRLCEQHGVQLWMAWGMLQRGKALTELGQIDEGISQIEQGLSVCRATGAGDRTSHIAWLAEGYGKRGQPEEGLTILGEALSQIDITGQHEDEAESYRLKGELLLQQSPANATEAETCFHQAISVAQNQQAKSWELRAATSLARLWQSQGERDEARELLEPVYSWFTEGFDTADLIDAKALLDVLS